MKYLIAILTLTILIGCNESEKENREVGNKTLSKEFSETLEKTEDLEQDLSEQIVLRGATSRQTISFRSLLKEIKIDILVLKQRPKDQKTLAHLFSLKKQLESIPVQARDEEFLTPFIASLNNLLIELSKLQNQDIADLNWPLWSENFNSGAGEFVTFSNKDNWAVGNRNREGYISARSSQTKAWLITPKFDLTEVYNPAMQLNHLVNIKKHPNSEVDAELINDRSLHILVSEDYEYGSPEEANWTKIETNDFNLIKDFNASLSEKISLQEFQGKIVSVAFVLDVDSRIIGGHGILWQINELTVFGAADELQTIKRKDPTVLAYSHDFTDGEGSYQQITSGDNPAVFELTTRNDETYLQVNGFKNKSNGVNLLVGPKVPLGDKSYSLKVTQAINFYNQPAKDKEYIKILVGENQDDVSKIEWKEVKFEQVPPGNNWNPVVSEWKDLGFSNTTIRLAFRYESGNGIEEYPNWSLYKILVKEE